MSQERRMSGMQSDGPLSLEDPSRHLRLRETLDRAGYSESAVLRQLGVLELPPFRKRQQNLPLLLWRTRGGTPLETLVRLFVLGQPASLATVREALSPLSAAEMTELGLLRVDGEQVRANVEMCPYQSLVLTADWPDTTEPVMGVAASTRTLAQMTPRRHVARALDLGTGCGALALLAAAHCDHVWGLDLNPRALQLTRFNALLNGRTNLTCLQGDLFEPIQGEHLDLIVCNPPFL